MKTKDDIRVLMDKIFQDLQKTREAGQKEYAHDDQNAFANFERLSKDLGISREQVLWVYVYKHIDGIKSYLKGHKSQREDVRGRIKDVIVYLILLWGMVDDNESTEKGEIRNAIEESVKVGRTINPNAEPMPGASSIRQTNKVDKGFHEPKGY
jgi:hypothetical protein